MPTNIWFWVAFHGAVLIVLWIDLLWQKRTPEPVTMGEAAFWSTIWVILSLGFNCVVWYMMGRDHALDFLTGYVIEYSLSVDNIFVFVLIFSFFRIPDEYQHRVLVWGIVGAFVLRGLMIWFGIALVDRFQWILYVFGALLIVTAIRMLTGQNKLDLENNKVLRLCRKWFPITPDYDGDKFTTRVNGALMLTPLALVLIVIDVMDLVFAVDSIPAVFAITRNSFIVYTSNICAILGLRSLYFLLANLVGRFVYLETGLAFILAFVGTKMVIAKWFHLANWASLLVIVVILAVTIIASITRTKKPVVGRNRK